MRNKRLRSAQNKGDDGRPNLIDFISRMPDDVLLTILSRLSIKRAVVTSSLSTRWRFVWRNLIKLNFDGSKTLDKMANDEKLCELEVAKYINQVNGVINSYNNNPRVLVFRIRFDLDESSSEDIDKWIRFALDKKVEKLDLNLMDKTCKLRDPAKNYDFTLPSSSAVIGPMLSLKRLYLKGVNLNEQTFNNILKNSPHLRILDIYGSVLFPHIRVGGRDIKLKDFKIVWCSGYESVSLYDFDLVSFQCCGPEIEFHLSDLPKLRELDIGEVNVGFENNVFSQISSCALYLHVLILDIYSAEKGLNVNAIIKLPNVKKLMLIVGAEKDDCLLEFTSIAEACPRLETISISLLEFTGYYGRISDLELAVYVIENSVALKRIVINPICDAYVGLTSEDLLKREQAARCSARRQLTPILPPGVDLAVL